MRKTLPTYCSIGRSESSLFLFEPTLQALKEVLLW